MTFSLFAHFCRLLNSVNRVNFRSGLLRRHSDILYNFLINVITVDIVSCYCFVIVVHVASVVVGLFCSIDLTRQRKKVITLYLFGVLFVSK